MKKLIMILLAVLMLTGCAQRTVAEVTTVETTAPTEAAPVGEVSPEIEYVSRYASATTIVLSDEGITVNGGKETRNVFTSRDLIYYEDRDSYDSGNPYGEGSDMDKHAAQEAENHLVVNITAPGAYVVTGKLSVGQIRVDLGDDAYEDPEAVVELILKDADITCTAAPAILFLNTYECDGKWSVEEAKAEVDTSAAGANLILEGKNKISGSYVAKIFKDKEGEKKLWKQDGAIYSYMSLNVFGPGALELTAENEGLDTELHLTINGGDLTIRSQNDGINTNEDGVSVTNIQAGTVRILAGLGEEGDGIDSNGYLVINGGTVISSANPGADAGLDSDLGSFINGGTVIALGSTMDWAESASGQVTMNLQFAREQAEGSTIRVTKEDGTELFFFDPAEDPVLGEDSRRFRGVILSCPRLRQGESCLVYVNGQQMIYSATDMGFGGMGPGENRGNGMPPEGFGEAGGEGPGGFRPDWKPEEFDGEMPAEFTLPEGETMPQGGFGGGRGQRPEGEVPEGAAMPEGNFGGRGQRPEGEMPEGVTPPDGAAGSMESAEGSQSLFRLQDMVNAFSGVMEMDE